MFALKPADEFGLAVAFRPQIAGRPPRQSLHPQSCPRESAFVNHVLVTHPMEKTL